MKENISVVPGTVLRGIYARPGRDPKWVRVQVEGLVVDQYKNHYIVANPIVGMEAYSQIGLVALPLSAFMAQGLESEEVTEPQDLSDVVVFLGRTPKGFDQVVRPGFLMPSALAQGGKRVASVSIPEATRVALPAPAEFPCPWGE